METRDFGATGLRVSALGFGAGHIGGDELDEGEVGWLLNDALDRGVTLFDTARSYGRSEERIGRHLAHRRGDFVLSTKGGYGVEGVPDWTYEAVARGIDEALGRLRTDRIDVFHLHSCDVATLARGDVVRALDDARRAGKIRVAAYSGENEALDHAVGSGAFGAVQCSVNPFDQRALGEAVARATRAGMGVIAKRALGNAPWRFAERPRGDYAEVYWDRMRAMYPDGGPPSDEWTERAIGFSAFAPGVSVALVGTRRRAHVARLVAAVEVGDRARIDAWNEEARGRFRAVGARWEGEI